MEREDGRGGGCGGCGGGDIIMVVVRLEIIDIYNNIMYVYSSYVVLYSLLLLYKQMQWVACCGVRYEDVLIL